MRLLPRRTRGNALMAAIFVSVVLCYLMVFSMLNAEDVKMKILPAEEHDFHRIRGPRDVDELDIDPPEDTQLDKKHQRHQAADLPAHINHNVYVNYDEDDDPDEANLDDAGNFRRGGVAVKKNNAAMGGDLHRMIAKNMDTFVGAVKEPNVLPNVGAQGGEVTKGWFLGYDQNEVQNCITHTVYGRVPDNLESAVLKPPKGTSPESNVVRKQSFHKVFAERAWGTGWDKAYDRLDASGRGAQLSWAQEVIATLHILINEIKSTYGKTRVKILDLPCGDMAWMSRFLVTRDDVDYTGIDIVPELINNHRKAYKSYPWKFRLVDILEEPLEESFDIIINRMMLQHLYYVDALRVLHQFSHSNSTVLLSTSFMREDTNIELNQEDNPGRIRKLNLQLPPISLIPPMCLVRDGPPDTFEGWDHYMAVWKLPLRTVTTCKHSWPTTIKGTDKTIYFCVDLSES